MRIIALIAVGLAATIGQVAAQTPGGGVLEHYRAYNAAIERDDLAAAAQEAELALAAAEASSDTRAGILALNLALVRSWRHDLPGALAPARRALALAEAGAPGVDPTVAALLVGRAELATSGRAGADRLSAIFEGDNLSSASAEDIYPAATELGLWALTQRRYELSETAWSIAGANASASPVGPQMGLAQARTWQAAAILSAEFRGRTPMDLDNVGAAALLLSESFQILRPLAEQASLDTELTASQRLMAQAMVWRGAMVAKMASDGQHLRNVEAQGDADGMAEIGPVDLSAPRCLIALQRPSAAALGRYYPQSAMENGGLGAAVMRIKLDDAGTMIDHDAVESLGGEQFANAANRMFDQFRTTRHPASAPGCRMPRTLLYTIVFQLGA